MSGILHVFTAQPDLYQVNYTFGTVSYARVCNRHQLEHLMLTPAAFDHNLISKVFHELTTHHKVTVAEVKIPEPDIAALGFEPLPSDA